MDELGKKILIVYGFATTCVSIMYYGIDTYEKHWRGPFWGMISFTAHALWYLPLIVGAVILLGALLPEIWKLVMLPSRKRMERIEKLEALKKLREEKNIQRRLELQKEKERTIIKQQEEIEKETDLKIKEDFVQKKKLRDVTEVSQDALKDFL